METTGGTTKILEKGPEYLRKQMELESETKGRVSAVERLAASKPRYVKSPHVVNSTQEPVIGLGSASVSSTGSSGRSSNRGGSVSTGGWSTEATGGAQVCAPGQVRRSSSKKRPDSLLLYRQKCELLRAAGNDRRHHVARRLLLNKTVPLLEAAGKECASEGDGDKPGAPEGAAEEGGSHGFASPSGGRRRRGVAAQGGDAGAAQGARAGLRAAPEFRRRAGKGVGRSHSDISSRYSKNFADFDTFFKYCGLDGEVVESLGRENFSARSDEIAINVRSVSVSTSDDGFSRSSGGGGGGGGSDGDGDGLLEDELRGKIRQGTSVIERNARIIKWLYSCKNAIENGKRLRDLD